MARDLDVELKGFDELSRALHDLSRAARRGILRKPLRAAAEKFQTKLAATSEWSDRTGDLRQSIKTKVRTRRGAIRADITGNYYGRFLEFGWIPGKRPTRRAARIARALSELSKERFVPPRPWIRPVFQAEKDGTLKELVSEMEKEIARLTKRVARKRARG